MQDNGHREAELPSPDKTTDLQRKLPRVGAPSGKALRLRDQTLKAIAAGPKKAEQSEAAAKGNLQLGFEKWTTTSLNSSSKKNLNNCAKKKQS